MRAVVSIVTAIVATATLIGPAPGAGAAPPGDQPRWSAPIQVGSSAEWVTSLLVAPDGSAQVELGSLPPDGCGGSECTRTYYERTHQGAWKPLSGLDVADAFDSQSRAWDVGTRSDGAGQIQVTIRSRPAGGAWSTPEDVPGLTAAYAYRPPRVLLTDDDRPVVTVLAPGSSSAVRILSAERRTDGTWIYASRVRGPLDSVAGIPVADGAVRFAWSDGIQPVIAERAADGTWASDVEPPVTGDHPTWIDPDSIVLTDTLTLSDASRVSVADRDSGGRWTARTLGSTLKGSEPSVTNADGVSAVVWTAVDHRLMVSTRTSRTGWSDPVSLARNVAADLSPSIVSDPNGNLTVAWAADDPTHTVHVRQRPVGGTWLPELRVPSAVARTSERGPVLGVAASGRVTLVTDLMYSADLTPPVAVTRVSTPTFHGWTPRPAFRVHWDTTWARTTGHDVRYRLYPSRSRASVLRTPLVDTRERSMVEHGPAGTYCLQARAHTTSSPVGPWSDRRCVTTPLDDRALAADRRWQRSGGETRTRAQGATLRLRDVRASRLALRVDRHSHGVVRVSFGGRSLGTFRLDRGRGPQHQIVELGRLGKVRHGALVVRVVSRGQLARIEGVYAGR